MRIALYIITENFADDGDEKYERYSSIFDEVVIVSNTQGQGSKIKNIKVMYKPFQQNFSDLRNAALDVITSDWIFSLDSDEEASPELIEHIPKLVLSDEIEGYWIPRRTYIRPDKYFNHGLLYPDYQLRLFRNRKEYRYTGNVHEQLTIPHEKTSHISVDILHHPKNPKYTSFSDVKNLLPYMNIQAEEIIKKEINGLSFLKRTNLVLKGITSGLSLFFNGFVRGKGFLDGWDGFRAHLLLSISIGGAYVIASQKK